MRGEMVERSFVHVLESRRHTPGVAAWTYCYARPVDVTPRRVGKMVPAVR
jgi:hypothetical protein